MPAAAAAAATDAAADDDDDYDIVADFDAAASGAAGSGQQAAQSGRSKSPYAPSLAPVPAILGRDYENSLLTRVVMNHNHLPAPADHNLTATSGDHCDSSGDDNDYNIAGDLGVHQDHDQGQQLQTTPAAPAAAPLSARYRARPLQAAGVSQQAVLASGPLKPVHEARNPTEPTTRKPPKRKPLFQAFTAREPSDESEVSLKVGDIVCINGA